MSEEFLEVVETGTPQEVQAAISKGADVNAKADNGGTPLMRAASGNKDPEVIALRRPESQSRSPAG